MERFLLAELEARLHRAMSKGACAPGPPVVCGPCTGPPTGARERVALWVQRLHALEPNGPPPLSGRRETVRRSRIHTWDSDGTATDFEIPASWGKEPAEVEAPPGRRAGRGDDYFCQGRMLHFYHPPSKGSPAVRAVFDGGPARGYRQEFACRIRVVLSAWAKELGAADRLFADAFHALVPAFFDLGTIGGPSEADGLCLRLFELSANPESLERCREKSGRALFYRASATIGCSARLEIRVISGSRPPKDRIKSIRYAPALVKESRGPSQANPTGPMPDRSDERRMP